uniref:F-box domain-containing protein n=1 Tax=Panagrolaimus davidi TaxID=227884 RepID=A0A914PAY5_9BILA
MSINELSLPSTILHYILECKKHNYHFHIRFSQTSKFVYKFVRRIRGYQMDALKISNEKSKIEGFKHSIVATLNIKDITKLKQKISAKSSLTFKDMDGADFEWIIKKINVSFLEQNITFTNCEIKQEEFEWFYRSSIKSLIFNEEFDGWFNYFSFDIVYKSIKNMENLRHIW